MYPQPRGSAAVLSGSRPAEHADGMFVCCVCVLCMCAACLCHAGASGFVSSEIEWVNTTLTDCVRERWVWMATYSRRRWKHPAVSVHRAHLSPSAGARIGAIGSYRGPFFSPVHRRDAWTRVASVESVASMQPWIVRRNAVLATQLDPTRRIQPSGTLICGNSRKSRNSGSKQTHFIQQDRQTFKTFIAVE